MRRIEATLGCSLALVGCSDDRAQPPWELPEVVASSKYIDYGAWADTSILCMDEKLAAWDAYIEDVAAYLGVEPPEERIRYTWTVSRSPAERWPCDYFGGCLRLDAEGHPFVFAKRVEMLHELVHAVEIPALGRTHRLLREGMAEYVSQSYSTDWVLPGFSDALIERLDGRPFTGQLDYTLAMHFVGSLIQQDGLEKYIVFREQVAEDESLDEFIVAYQDVYGRDFADSLRSMESKPVRGRWQPWGCDAASVAVPWTKPDLLEATLRGECGDGEFYGGGIVGGEPGFSKVYTVDVTTAAIYELSLSDPNEPMGQAVATVSNCPTTEASEILASSIKPQEGLLREGRYSLRIDFPAASEARGEVELRLRLIYPVP